MSINVCNNNSLSAITSIPDSITGSALNLISTQTASSSATIDFTSGIDSTYDAYMFKFYNIHPATDNSNFSFQVDTGTNTNYNITTTNTLFHAFHYEADGGESLTYDSSRDLAQSTSFTVLIDSLGTDNDQNASGTLQLFSPSSSTFVKHFIGSANTNTQNDGSINCFSAGYFNTTTPLTRVQFKMSSGNIDSGVIKLYGIS
jgi:hypothetical protein